MTRGMLEEFVRQLQSGSQIALVFGALVVIAVIAGVIWLTR